MQTHTDKLGTRLDERVSLIRDAVLVVQLILVCTMLRLLVADLPNVAPIAAMSLFAGLWVQRKWLALLAPLATLWISDRILNESSYELPLMLLVYASLSAPVWFGPLLKSALRKAEASKLESSTKAKIARRQVLKTATFLFGGFCCVLAGSICFFIASNLGVWWYWYERDANGLAQCFTAAIPFFRFTLVGDFTFAAMFGAVHLATSLLTTPTSNALSLNRSSAT